MTGIVYIVGAGPGDPGLITVRGRACLRDSDVVVYDNLAPRELLDEARPDAELIYAGKRAADHALRQSEINEILIDRARGGKIVCRLKGGDPFLFGRGGEETTHLAAARVPFVVVPGVSAAIAVPAYAGIPVTHRAYSVTLCVSTGHEDPAKEASDLDWSLLAGPMRTLVFFMGVRTLPHIRERLIAHGMPDSTPVALIERGTTPWQRTAVGTLADIAQIAEERRFAPPCLVVVGEVVRLRDEMVWYEKRPLFGVTVMNTRATHQAADLSRRLADLGARVVEVPLIAIAEPADREPLLEAARALDTFDWIVLTSTNAVDALWNAVREIGRDARAPLR
ncbi:uroporphyrinogen-III C-methyltransferase, partial [bacterium]|nr:uroporphyrinogen-III C-methyltransferase [bacterium]